MFGLGHGRSELGNLGKGVENSGAEIIVWLADICGFFSRSHLQVHIFWLLIPPELLCLFIRDTETEIPVGLFCVSRKGEGNELL